jgi:predicted O-methyltransferase YrrM
MISAEQYAGAFSSPLSPLLAEILEYTESNHPAAHMISGHVQGQFLSIISNIIRPGRILEIGTFTGFSALCMAEGLQESGLLYTIEMREADADTAQGFFNRSKYSDHIKLLRGNAAEIIPALNETWDLVFIDADKTGYINYYEMVMPHLRPGGIILADNVLFHGEVLHETVKGKNAIAIDAFNKHVQADQRNAHVLLTIRDGITMVRKK